MLTEPTSGRLVVANAGALTFELRIAGQAAHASTRLEGRGAIDAYLPIHAALADLERERNVHGDPLFGEVVDAVGRVEGRKIARAAAPYGSDLRLYAGLGGIPTVHYGPGDVRFAHAPREQVDIESRSAQIAHSVLPDRSCRVLRSENRRSGPQ